MKLMSALALAALCIVSTPSLADTDSAKTSVHFVLNGGFTFGGDTLESIYDSNGHTTNIKAGNLAQIGLGALVKAGSIPVEAQLTANYHWHSASYSNGSATFSRVPVELTAYYNGVRNWRFGGGVRYVSSPRLGGMEFLGGANIKFKNTVGEILEAGYYVSPNTVLSMRYVFERYKFDGYNGYTGSVNGNHLGLFVTGVF